MRRRGLARHARRFDVLWAVLSVVLGLGFVLGFVGIVAYNLIRGEPTGLGDPKSGSHALLLRNATSVRIFASDDSSYASKFRELPLEPGQAREVEIGYLSFYGDTDTSRRRKNEFCLVARTESREIIYDECSTWGELEDAGWKLSIVTEASGSR